MADTILRKAPNVCRWCGSDAVTVFTRGCICNAVGDTHKHSKHSYAFKGHSSGRSVRYVCLRCGGTFNNW